MPIGPNTTGKDFNFFKRVTVTETNFPSTPQIVINIRDVRSFTMLNEGDQTIEYSFNGNTVHGDLIPNSPSAGLTFDERTVGKVWLRAAGTSTLRFEAWSKR